MNKLWQQLDNYLLQVFLGATLVFTVLYPKLPSIQVTNTWVYIRLEDFLILVTSCIWFIQILRRKVSLPKPEGLVILGYWAAGFISLVYCLLLIAPHLANFFPKIAAFEYIRRIEYMILFFVGFSSIKNKKDIYRFISVLFVTVTGVIIYGFGQRFYLTLWHQFPKFFEKNPFCFPAFLTGNEEFAKGKPFCLSETSRVSSTFGGHYDLAAFLVFAIPILIAVFIVMKRWYLKLLAGLVAFFAIALLNFTSSRTSFAAYTVGVIVMLILWKKKLWIIPVFLGSLIAMLLFSTATLQRFAKTIQPVQVVTINNTKSLPSNLQNIIKKTKETEENKTPESPPPGTITIGNSNIASTGAVTTVVTANELKQLDLNNAEISTVSGSFLISKAYALDISFTTRFQAEWPRDIIAFQKYPLLGQGYSSLTLASDNDYLRALGETGLIGTISFLFIFLILGMEMKFVLPSIKDSPTIAFLFGLSGGVIGLLLNAVLIDVFEASKVAEPLWILLGLGAGILSLYKKRPVGYAKALQSFFASDVMIGVYLIATIVAVFWRSLGNFFVGDDFTWLRWAASGNVSNVKNYFLDASGFFYRPITKTLMYILYQFLSFNPSGYHLFNLFLHFLVSLGVYLVAQKILKHKFFSFLCAFMFSILPSSFENVYWISTLSTNLEAVGVVYSLWFFLKFRENNKLLLYLSSLITSFFALLSYEGGIIIPLILITADLFFTGKKITKRWILIFIPYIFADIAYFFIRHFSHAVTASGDYSYNVAHLFPNIIGNLLGYVGLYLTGQQILPFYTLLRITFKTDAKTIEILLLIMLFIIVGLLYQRRQRVCNTLKHPIILPICGFTCLMIIGLLPFLGFGNIAARYSYVGGIGFVLLVGYLLMQIKKTWVHDSNRMLAYVATAACVIFLIINDLILLNQTNKDWMKAGIITSQALRYFRAHNENLLPGSSVYISNLPIRYGNAWVFPVGFADGLWFIYRDDTMQVITISSLNEVTLKNSSQHVYVFTFDKKYMVSEIE